MPISKHEQKLEFFLWLDNPDKQKGTRDEKCTELGVHKNTAINWYKEWKLTKEIVGATGDDARRKVVEDALYKEASMGKTNAAELLARMKGWLASDKLDVRHLALTIDDYDRITKEAEGKRIALRRELSVGDTGLQGRPPVLPDQVCEDREPVGSNEQGGELAAMALPDTVT